MKIFALLSVIALTAAAQTIPSKTSIVVKTVDAVDSKTADAGKTYNASLDEPIVTGSTVVASKGAKVLLKVVEVKESGKITGNAGLTIAVSSVEVASQMVSVDTESVTTESAGKGKSTAKKAAIFGGIGAAVGAVAGGGKGAAIGGAAGAGAGTAVSMATSGPTVKIPSETRLTFTTR